MSEVFDAVVVGGGPAGCATAERMSRAGFRVGVFERSPLIGQPVQCSGLVTERTLRRAQFDPSHTDNQLLGAVVYSPNGTRYEIGGDRVHAYVLDRARFDHAVYTQSLASGAEVITGARVVGIWPARGGHQLQLAGQSSGTVWARLIIGADGPRSLVADYLGLPPVGEILRARGAEVRLPQRPSTDRVHLFSGARYAPGFFAWIIPLGGERYRIGWATSHNTRGHLAALTEDYPEIFRGMEVLSQTGGLIPVGPRAATAADGGLVVGDAAGQAKATSGGGLYTALVCAEHGARAAIHALTSGDTSAATLAAYDRGWRAHVGVELRRAVAIRRAYRALSDNEIEWGLRLLRVPGMRALVDRYGDIDYPSRLAGAVLTVAPPLLQLFGRGNLDELYRDEGEQSGTLAGAGASPAFSASESIGMRLDRS